MKRLSSETQALLPAAVARPSYDRAQLKAGIVHLGTGAFHRAHQAVYVERVVAKFGGDWGIIGSSLRSRGVADQMNPQDGLYTVVVRDTDQESMALIGCVKEVIFAPEQPQLLIDVIANRDIKILTLTITEKGYCHDPASGNLLLSHPGVQQDLADLTAPVTALGYMCAGLKARFEQGNGAITLLSCDNLPNNGKVLKKVLLQFAQQVDATLADWIAKNVSFPCSMIDRIVPATTDADKARIEAVLGLRDEAMVVTEPFTQWVVEDNFAAGRPAFEAVGVQMVADVTAYEEIKLRFLNGAHSMLAYSGYMAGFDFIYQVMQSAPLVAALERFWRTEVEPTVEAPDAMNLGDYQRQLSARFANAALAHKTYQIAMDGSQKIPQRWLNTLRAQLASGGSITLLSFGLANWIRYVGGVNEQGAAITVQDPMAAVLRDVHQQHGSSHSDLVAAILRLEDIFGADLAANTRLSSALVGWLDQLQRLGTLEALRQALAK